MGMPALLLFVYDFILALNLQDYHYISYQLKLKELKNANQIQFTKAKWINTTCSLSLGPHLNLHVTIICCDPVKQ